MQSSPYRQPIVNYPNYNPYPPSNYTNNYYPSPSQSYYQKTNYPNQISYGSFDQNLQKSSNNLYYTPIQNKQTFNELNLSENRNYTTGEVA